jgi:3D (Asp-Asp-Asp) domain-containing protein
VIPYGTKVYIDGVGVRIAQDCGGIVKERTIDLSLIPKKK